MRRVLSIALILAAAPAVGDDVYRWVDHDGVVNYTQQRPNGVSAEHIRTRNGGSRSVVPVDEGSEEGSDAANGELSAQQQQMLEDLEAAERDRVAKVEAIREANCEKAKSVLDNLTRSNRVRVREASGEERVIGEDERQQRIQDAQKGIAVNCSTAPA